MAQAPSIAAKWSGLVRRLVHVYAFFPQRARRLGGQFSALRQKKPRSWGWWILETGILFLDLLGAMDLYETVAEWVKWRTRPLTDAEIQTGRDVFGDSLDWRRVRIDDRAWLGPRQWRLCYVSGYTINSWGPMSNPLLVHELMHVWQYHHRGLVYIPRALRAYHSKEGYNYGGVEQLRQLYRADCGIDALNYEQQGDLVADYYRLTRGLPPQWGFAGMDALPIYRYFLQDIRRVQPNREKKNI